MEKKRFLVRLRCGELHQIEGVEYKCVDNKNRIYHIYDKDDNETLVKRQVAIIADPDLILILKP